MNDNTSTPTDNKADIESLRSAVEEMDSMSQSGLGAISMIARFVLRSLETPQGRQNI